MTIQLIPFDMADILDSEDAIVEYVRQVLADGDTDEMLRAVGYIYKALRHDSRARVAFED